MYQLTESSRLVRWILGQSRTGGQLLTANALPPPEFDGRPRWIRMEWEPLSRVPCRREEPCAVRPLAQLAAPSLRIAVGVGRKGDFASPMFSIDSRPWVSRIISYGAGHCPAQASPAQVDRTMAEGLSVN